MEDDEYRGMHIPKGATVLLNTRWISKHRTLNGHSSLFLLGRSMTWDERHYHDPRSFKPERFLPKPEGAGETFPQGITFGWGRR